MTARCPRCRHRGPRRTVLTQWIFWRWVLLVLAVIWLLGTVGGPR
jgi:hypothetical protein